MPRTLILALAIAALSPTWTAQENENFCGMCKDQGLVDCDDKRCKKTVCDLEQDHVCVEIYALECCRGQRKVPCTWCNKGNSKFSFDLEMESRKGWIEGTQKLNKSFQIPYMIHLSTAHFNLHYDIPRIKVGMKYYDMNEGMHLYAQRLEELYDDWVALLGNPYQLPQTRRWEIYMTNDVAERDRVTHTTIGGSATKQFGQRTSTYAVAAGKRDMKDDEERHANVYHHASHLITQQGHPIGKFEYPGWWTVGVAHWMERAKFEETRNFCTGEVGTKKDKWQNGGWDKKVYSMVGRDKEPRLASFEKLDTQQLSTMQHAFAWSMVDYILSDFPDKAGDIGRTITGSGDVAKAFREHLGTTVARFHDDWRSYVLKAYAR
ncbi:MAG: hypothetical protein KDB53_15965 [Planctomycetes bacterium]|nr:hypothetical protein [Planctomycetota bacterium]